MLPTSPEKKTGSPVRGGGGPVARHGRLEKAPLPEKEKGGGLIPPAVVLNASRKKTGRKDTSVHFLRAKEKEILPRQGFQDWGGGKESLRTKKRGKVIPP